MSQYNNIKQSTKVDGSKLEHGKEHSKDHKRWSRRQFLFTGGMAGLGSMLFGNIPVAAAAPNPLMAALNDSESDKVVVLLRMFGGNDGLNMIVPNSDATGRPEYLQYRPNVGLNTNEITPLYIPGSTTDSGLAMPNYMSAIQPMWDEGNMAVVHNVGYMNQDLSHFFSSRLWATAADRNVSDPRLKTGGWQGRYLDNLYPAFLDAPPSVPPALQIGATNNEIFKAPGNVNMDLIINSPDEFYQLVQGGELYNTSGYSNCAPDVERVFLRQMANNSFRYADAIRDAYNGSSNSTNANYPAATNSNLHNQLQIVSRLIKGNLGTKVYMVYLSGFDTHGDQRKDENHLNLLKDVTDTIKAFYDDLTETGHDQKVLTMSFSEFGRTIKDNGSGTDHGTMSAQMLFGPCLTGGFHGTPINLKDDRLSQTNDTRVHFDDEDQTAIDFRAIYTAMLKDWLCVDQEVVEYVLGGDYADPALSNLIADPCTPSIGSNDIAALMGHRQSITNPNVTEFRYAVNVDGNIRLRILNLSGQPLVTLKSGFQKKGHYIHNYDRMTDPLPPGKYIYRLDTSGRTFSRLINL